MLTQRPKCIGKNMLKVSSPSTKKLGKLGGPRRKVVVRKRTDGSPHESSKAMKMDTLVTATLVMGVVTLAVVLGFNHSRVLGVVATLPFLVLSILSGLGLGGFLYIVHQRRAQMKTSPNLARSNISSPGLSEQERQQSHSTTLSAIPEPGQREPTNLAVPPADATPETSMNPSLESDRQEARAGKAFQNKPKAGSQGGSKKLPRPIKSVDPTMGSVSLESNTGAGSWRNPTRYRRALTIAFQVFCVLLIGLSTVKIKRMINEGVLAGMKYVPGASKFCGLVGGVSWLVLSLVFYGLSKAKSYMEGEGTHLASPDVLIDAKEVKKREGEALAHEGGPKAVDPKPKGSTSQSSPKASESSVQSGSEDRGKLSDMPDEGEGEVDQEAMPEKEPEEEEEGMEEELDMKSKTLAEIVRQSTSRSSVLDISDLMNDEDEGENLKTKSEIVTQVPPGKWVKENDRDWKVVERKKRSLDFSMTFAIPEAEEEEEVAEVELPPPPSVDEAEEEPMEEEPKEEEPEEEPAEDLEGEEVLDPSKIRGSPEIPCLEGMDMEFDRDGDLKRDSEYLKLRREKWIESYKSRSRMLAEEDEDPCLPDACRENSLMKRLECWAIRHPRTLLYIVFLSLLTTVVACLCCGDYQMTDYLICRALGASCQWLVTKAELLLACCFEKYKNK